MDIIAEPSNRGTLLMTQGMLESLNSRLRSGATSVSLLTESYTTMFYGEAFKPFSPFYESINMKIHQIIAGGLYDLWHRNEENPTGIKRKIEDIPPQVLTLEHLQMGFKISLCPLALSAVVFLIEVLFAWCKSYYHSCIILAIITAYIKVKEKECENRRIIHLKSFHLGIIKSS